MLANAIGASARKARMPARAAVVAIVSLQVDASPAAGHLAGRAGAGTARAIALHRAVARAARLTPRRRCRDTARPVASDAAATVPARRPGTPRVGRAARPPARHAAAAMPAALASPGVTALTGG